MSARRGFSLVELLVSMVIAGIIGVALTRLVINQARFVSMQDSMMRARSSARASINVLIDELRMVGLGGMLSGGNGDSVTVRVPYAFGVACFRTSGYTVVSLHPTDSATFYGADPSGYAWRNQTTGNYVFQDGATVFTGSINNVCSPVGISTLSVTGWAQTFAAVTQNTSTDTTASVYLYQRIRYSFAPSTQLPGRLALWRHVISSGLREELVAPFDTASGFSFLVGSRYTPQATAPVSPDSIRGLRLRLKTASETNPQGRNAPATFDVSLNIYFRNYYAN